MEVDKLIVLTLFKSTLASASIDALANTLIDSEEVCNEYNTKKKENIKKRIEELSTIFSTQSLLDLQDMIKKEGLS